MRRVWQRTLLAVVAILLISTLAGKSLSPASALGQNYFDDSNGVECDFIKASNNSNLCGNASLAVRIVSGNSTSVTSSIDQFKAYYRLPYTTQVVGGKTIDVLNAAAVNSMNIYLTVIHADYCPSTPIGANPPIPGNGTAVDTLNNGYYLTHQSDLTGGMRVTQYTITNSGTGNVTRTQYGRVRTVCDSAHVNDLTFNLNASDFTWTTGIAGLFEVQFNANFFQGDFPGGKTFACPQANPTNSNCAGIMNSFSLTEVGSDGAAIIAQVGTQSSGDIGNSTTIREQNPAQDTGGTSTNATFIIRFGADCTVTDPAGTPAQVRFFDLDFSPKTQGQIALQMKRTDANGTVHWLNSPAADDDDANGNGGTTNSTGGWTNNPAANWLPPSNNGNTTHWHFVAFPNDKYQLYIENVNPILTQQFSTPFDGIFNEFSCDNSSTVTPTVGISQSPVAAGSNVTLTGTLTNNSANDSSVSNATWQVWYSNTNTPNTFAAPSVTNQSLIPGNIPLGGGKWQTTTSTTVSSGYNYICARLVPSSPADNTVTFSPTSAQQCWPIASSPYMSVWGGDAVAGASPTTTAGTCYNDSTAGFIGWNDGSAGTWGAAGSQWATQAMGSVIGFASGRGSTSGTPGVMTFANPPVSGNNYGGVFGSTSNVNCDYSSDINSAAAADKHAGNWATGAISIASGNRTIVVKGNVSITGNIIYTSSGSWAKISDIPSFKLIAVGGNIYIDPSVGELDGTYIAEPDSSNNGGTIYTCAIGYNAVIPSSAYATCNNPPLKIYGSFVAKQVQFLRTSGSYSNQADPTKAAEEFIYGPEMWMSGTPGLPATDNSITGLPPIL